MLSYQLEQKFLLLRHIHLSMNTAKCINEKVRIPTNMKEAREILLEELFEFI